MRRWLDKCDILSILQGDSGWLLHIYIWYVHIYIYIYGVCMYVYVYIYVSHIHSIYVYMSHTHIYILKHAGIFRQTIECTGGVGWMNMPAMVFGMLTLYEEHGPIFQPCSFQLWNFIAGVPQWMMCSWVLFNHSFCHCYSGDINLA